MGRRPMLVNARDGVAPRVSRTKTWGSPCGEATQATFSPATATRSGLPPVVITIG
jgi:hypothetical protein